MKVLTAEQIAKVYEVTDALRLHRNWIVVPLSAHETGAETVMPDGKVLLRPPARPDFDEWVRGLRARLEKLEIHRTPRAEQRDTNRDRVPPGAPTGSGSRRLYLDWE